MGIQSSNLEEKDIKDLLKQNYGLEVLQIEEINRGTANIFKITTIGNKKYILKEFSEGRTKESVIKETNIINYLNDKKIKVPIYIKSTKEEFYIENKGRIIILQEFIDGYTMKNNTGDYKKTIESATILGKMAKVLEEYEGLEDEHIVEKWFSKKSLQNGIPKMIELQKNLKEDNKYKEKFYNDLDEKIKISKILEKEFDFEITKKMTFMNAHGDYSVQQLIYNDKEGTTVIDFETAKKLPIIWEVMRSYSYIDKEAVNGILNIDTLIEYVKEFSKYVTLNKYDLMYAPHIYLMQIVSSVFGYKQYNENYEKVGLLEFAFFRTNLCKFLYEHLNEISERLQNEIL